jgi:hypothetical protein
VLRARLELLRLMLGLVVLGLIVLRLVLLRLMVLMVLVMLLLLARIELLRLTRRERLPLDARLLVIVTVVAVILHISAQVARLLLEIRLSLAQLLLRGGDQTKVMFGVLIIVFSGHRISGTLRVTGELEIFLGDVRRRTPDFYILPV